MNVHIQRIAACAALLALLILGGCAARQRNLLAYQDAIASMDLEETDGHGASPRKRTDFPP